MKMHRLKTRPEYFEAVWQGDKKFEVRRDDRQYEVGDDLLLCEYDPTKETYTDRTYRARITYIYRGPLVPEDCCILSFKKLPRIG